MICPKCQSQMRTYDRQGVHIDRCDGCQGIFLDRGELERVVSAEQRHYGAVPPDPHSPQPYPGQHPGQHPGQRRAYPDSPRGYGGGYADSPPAYRGGYNDSPRPYRRRRKGFLEQLFD
ncbi:MULTISPECIES: zf-TFIIB domain-containing protein [unclassified Nocardiopsis]|uniref:TFIIB-type zinc ribbon-containing protein n=2 Tax=Nocardiopsis TaxID=2013 RepID=UPI000D709547|nr:MULTISPECIES: zf-TFIIB domain-containing protein [unclassified Nocardiopsis]MBQ1084502.1 zf-TFIIB domain-containing protein [Nocardiopsis sp. B62]